MVIEMEMKAPTNSTDNTHKKKKQFKIYANNKSITE